MPSCLRDAKPAWRHRTMPSWHPKNGGGLRIDWRLALNGRIGKNVIHFFHRGRSAPRCPNLFLFCPPLRGQETDRAFRDDERGSPPMDGMRPISPIGSEACQGFVGEWLNLSLKCRASGSARQQPYRFPNLALFKL